MSTTICVLSRNMKKKQLVFDCKISNIFEYACFRNIANINSMSQTTCDLYLLFTKKNKYLN